jgi:hypothetical protein
MRGVRWIGVFAVMAILSAACGSPATGDTASASRGPTPSYTKPGSRICQENPTPRPFARSAPSNRNLEVVWLRDRKEGYLVQDITDYLHPIKVRGFDGAFGIKFVSGAEVSYVSTRGLIRSSLEDPPHGILVACGGGLFDWSPDGTLVAYTVPTEDPHVLELLLMRDGRSAHLSSISLPYESGCLPRLCTDKGEFKLLFSPNGAFLSLVQSTVEPTVFRLWTSDGKLIKSLDGSSATMAVWSGNALYWRTDNGVVRWLDGKESVVLPGVAWVRPHGSPAGGQIVYETRDSIVGTAHIFMFDTASGKVREIAASRSEPFFLNPHLIWYKEERPCAFDERYPCGAEATTIETGKTYIYDLLDKTETESVIDKVFDTWPHSA